MTIRVVVADDQDLVRTGLVMILDAEDDLEVVAVATDGAVAVQLAGIHRPDVVVMDLRMPVMDGVEATRRIRATDLDTRVLVLTTFDADDHLHEALAAGADGFLLKTAPPERLVQAIRQVHAGETTLAPDLTRRLVADFVARPAPGLAARTVLPELTPREAEVLALVAHGMDNQEVADRLVLGVATVKTHLNRVFAKLGVRTRSQAIVLAWQTGLVRPGRTDEAERG